MITVEDFLDVGASDPGYIISACERVALKTGQDVEDLKAQLVMETIEYRAVVRRNHEEMERCGLVEFAIKHAIAQREKMNAPTQGVFDAPGEKLWKVQIGMWSGQDRHNSNVVSVEQDLPGLNETFLNAPALGVGEVVNGTLYLLKGCLPEFYDVAQQGVERLMAGALDGGFPHLVWHVGDVNPGLNSAKDCYDIGYYRNNYTGVVEVDRLFSL